MAKTPAATKRTSRAAKLKLLSTGVPGLDEILGGGLPEFSLNLIAGSPGSGKTTLAMQLLFANATAARPGLFITLLGETSLKMLRYQQQFDFFDLGRVGADVHFLNLSEEALSGDLETLLARVIAEVDRLHPGYVVVDSFRSLVRSPGADPPGFALDHLMQRLALHLTTWEITAFLIGEYEEQELRNPVFTVADGIIWLSQATERNSVVRKVQIVKMRGMSMMPGLHTARITAKGLQFFPRMAERLRDEPRPSGPRLSTGIRGLDEMMGGGIPPGDSLVLAGPTGAGKTTFALQFVAAGLRAGESVVISIFEEHPEAYLDRAKSVGVDLREALSDGKLRIIYLRPLDLSVDETLEEIRTSVKEIGATRVVIDSISGFEVALAPTFREDFRESLYRLIGALTGLGVTIFSTVEVVDASRELQLTGYRISFLTDDILALRMVEIDGELRKVLVVVKMRGSKHSQEFRGYDITSNGVLLRDSLKGYDGIMTGIPTRRSGLSYALPSGLTENDVIVLEAVVRGGPLTAAEVADRVGVELTVARTVLERLLLLEYVDRKGTRYRGTARSERE